MDFNDIILTEEEMYERLAYWQKVLKLDAWAITLHICPENELPLDDVQGCCSVCDAIRSAVIHICSHRPSCLEFRFNMEQTLIHELIHCKMNFFAPRQHKNKEKYLVYEQEVDSLATILYNLNKKDESNDSKKIVGSKAGKNTTGKSRKRITE